jgi:hypothetical protein
MPESGPEGFSYCGVPVAGDEDVEGHDDAPRQTAKMTMSWTVGPNGERLITFESDDPEAEVIVSDLVALASRVAAAPGAAPATA